MIAPRTSLPRRSDRDERAYYYTQAMGGIDRAFRVSTDEFKYVDLYNDDVISRQSSINDRVIVAYNGAKVSCRVGFSNGSVISIEDGASLSFEEDFTNLSDITVKATGKLSISKAFVNRGSVTVEPGGTLEILGALVDEGTLTIEAGADVEFIDGSPGIMVSVRAFVELEDASIEDIARVGCSIAETVLSPKLGYSMALYGTVAVKRGDDLTGYVGQIGLDGFTLAETLQGASTSVLAPIDVACARFDKVRHVVTVTEVLAEDHSIGPTGTPGETPISIKHGDAFTEADFATREYLGYSLTETRRGSLSGSPVLPFYGFAVTKDETAYAVYSLVEYSVTYVLNGGSGAAMATYTVISGLALQNPVKAGHSFAGWYLDADFTAKKSYIVPGEIGNKVLFAKFVTN